MENTNLLALVWQDETTVISLLLQGYVLCRSVCFTVVRATVHPRRTTARETWNGTRRLTGSEDFEGKTQFVCSGSPKISMFVGTCERIYQAPVRNIGNLKSSRVDVLDSRRSVHPQNRVFLNKDLLTANLLFSFDQLDRPAPTPPFVVRIRRENIQA